MGMQCTKLEWKSNPGYTNHFELAKIPQTCVTKFFQLKANKSISSKNSSPAAARARLRRCVETDATACMP